MIPTRRQLLRLAIALPIAGIVARALTMLAATGAALRPAGDGSSAARCAACGARDHAMLDPSCPAAPRVLG